MWQIALNPARNSLHVNVFHQSPYVQYYSTSRTIIITLIIATMFCKYSMFEVNYSLLLFK